MIEKQQALLARVMNLFAERFDKRAILRGGMVLRVLGCDRLTNDLDYVFVPYKSKKDIVDEIIKTLNEVEGAGLEYSLNSKCLRIILTVEGISIQIEAKVAMQASTRTVSTKEVADTFGLPARLIQVVDYHVALANKMAAWNERRLIRDIYDIWFYIRMNIRPDEETLRRRLSKCLYSRLIDEKDYFQGKEIREFYDFLISYVNRVTDADIKDVLEDYLEADDIPGLAMKFRTEISKLKM